MTDTCRVCSTRGVRNLGILTPYVDYSCPVYQCETCGSRFTEHSVEAHDRLHRSAESSYRRHEQLAQTSRKFLDDADLEGLRASLVRSASYRFVIERLAALGSGSRVCEVGCSKGALGAYFIARGYDYIGTDVSPAAVDRARELFGDSFCLVGSPRADGPFDAIFHTGTIGCVARPLEFTHDLLSRLRTGGLLVFNSPNVAATLPGDLWLRSTVPPDLITLFSEEFWMTRFVDLAESQISVETLRDGAARVKALKRHTPLRRRAPPPRGRISQVSEAQPFLRMFSTVGRTAFLRLLSLIPGPLPEEPADFGLMVQLSARK